MSDAALVPISQVVESEYRTIIGQYIPYFNELPDAGKKRFVERTIHFRSVKTFTDSGMEDPQVDTHPYQCRSAINTNCPSLRTLMSPRMLT